VRRDTGRSTPAGWRALVAGLLSVVAAAAAVTAVVGLIAVAMLWTQR
jgi:hypothetical protein